MKIAIFELNDTAGDFAAYAVVVRDEESGGYLLEDIRLLGASPAEAGTGLTKLLTEHEAATPGSTTNTT